MIFELELRIEPGRIARFFGEDLLRPGIEPAEADLRSAHGAALKLNQDYRDGGIPLPQADNPMGAPKGFDWSRALVIAPPSANGTPWMRRFGPVSAAFASGWMSIRGARRRRGVDRGFVLSDHVDWPSLLSSIEATGAECVWVTHGYREPVVRWLREHGIQALAVASRWEGESDDVAVDAPAEEGAEVEQQGSA